MMFEMDCRSIVIKVIKEHQQSPIDMLEIGGTAAQGEMQYLNSMKDLYVQQLRDIVTLFDEERDGRTKILEIGSFLGAVSISLKQLGFDVWAQEIPEFEKPPLKRMYQKYGIPFAGVNLRKYELPYESEFFDCVIMCDVIEHLNFNPLPMLLEINRILKKDGFFYVMTPNQCEFTKRMRMLVGKSVHHPIELFFKQLDRSCNMVAGVHWREYTLSELVMILKRMGFTSHREYRFAIRRGEGIKKAIKQFASIFPSLRSHNVVIAQKRHTPVLDFWLTEANS